VFIAATPSFRRIIVTGTFASSLGRLRAANIGYDVGCATSKRATAWSKRFGVGICFLAGVEVDSLSGPLILF